MGKIGPWFWSLVAAIVFTVSPVAAYNLPSSYHASVQTSFQSGPTQEEDGSENLWDEWSASSVFERAERPASVSEAVQEQTETADEQENGRRTAEVRTSSFEEDWNDTFLWILWTLPAVSAIILLALFIVWKGRHFGKL